MAWIESHSVLIRHQKLVELARDLRLRPAYVLGHLHALWHAALEQKEDGDLSAWSDEFIAEMSNYSGDAPQFVRLLQEHRWLDGKLIHDWLDYAGRYLTSKYRISNPKKLKEIYRKHKSVFRQTKDSLKPDQRQPTLPYLTLPDQPNQNKKEAREVLEFLNEKAGKNFRLVDANINLIAARLKSGATAAQCRQIIALKCRKWKGDPKTEEWLRPSTLFGKEKFEQYIGELLIHVDDNGVS